MKYLQEILETSVITNAQQIGPCIVDFYSENEKHHDEQLRFELLPFGEFQIMCGEIARINELKYASFAEIRWVWIDWQKKVMERCKLKWWSEGKIK